MIGNPLKVVALRRFAASTDATKLFNGNCTVCVKSNVRMEDDHILKRYFGYISVLNVGTIVEDKYT